MDPLNFSVEISKDLYLSTLHRRKKIGSRFSAIISCIQEEDIKDIKEENEFNLNLKDGDSSHFAQLIPEIIKYYEANKSNRILVHCALALSRSPATILVILVYNGMDLLSAKKLIEDKRRCPLSIYSGFIQEIVKYFGVEKCYGFKVD